MGEGRVAQDGRERGRGGREAQRRKEQGHKDQNGPWKEGTRGGEEVPSPQPSSWGVEAEGGVVRLGMR